MAQGAAVYWVAIWHHVAVCVRPAARDQVLDLICAFHAEHGRLPRWLEWEHAAEDRPCARTIERRWGWRNVMAEAVGVEVDGLELWEGMVDERARRMLSALAEARDELGRWPFAEEWEQSGRKPSRRSFVRYFGSWEEACGATGAAVRIANVPGLSGVSMPEVDRLG